MVPAACRLRHSADFAAVIRLGRRAGRGTLVVHLAAVAQTPPEPTRPGSPELPVRVGFVVSKAVGGAVVRNRVRRRLRHLAADRLGALPGGTDVVVRALPSAAAAAYPALGADLDAALAAAARPRRPRGRQ
ncbi:hypothetical protein GCM10010124_38030 [Pilimelia terevasa]|uniref:Ribonuclease P protein component n=1 Tax=Pilimelia terevasa TaxID=53372 RepID=A0A8J3BQ83_9ACTN|nr:ribonuclease P protein component [Pilimelia terevasa]GGK41578.1 hypothetical protein GCM10010124_38030 [Pilimelia terevasa]